MIKICYCHDLRPGLNASAINRRRGVVIYLLPGLTSAQRRAALRRLRQQGRMKLGPRLPQGQLAVAMAGFRIRNGFGQAGLIMRAHPAAAVPVLVVSGLVAAFVLTSVSVRIVPPQATGSQVTGAMPVPGPATSVEPGVSKAPGGGPGSAPAAHSQQAPAPPGSSAPVVTPTSPDSPGSPGGSPLTSAAASSPPGSRPPPAPAPAPSTIAATSPASPAPSPSTSSPGTSTGGNCVTLGLIEICL